MISKEEVQKIAKLARLSLTNEEVEKMQKDLSSILDYFDLLKKAKGGPNLRMTSESKNMRNNATRKDEVAEKPASLANNLISAAPERKEDYIKVKQIL